VGAKITGKGGNLTEVGANQRGGEKTISAIKKNGHQKQDNDSKYSFPQEEKKKRRKQFPRGLCRKVVSKP